MFVEDLANHLAANGVGTVGTNIFLSSKATVPTGSGPYLVLTQTSGRGPTFTHNEDAPATRHPGAQLVFTAGDDRARTPSGAYAAAEAMAQAAYDVIVRMVNTRQGGFYLNVVPLQEPFDLGLDATNRARVAFNVTSNMRD